MVYRFLILFNLVFFWFSPKAICSPEVTNTVVDEIKIEKIEVEGSNVYREQIDNLVKDRVNRALSLEEAHLLKEQITEFYTSRGYINSGAFIPAQDFSSGQLKIIVIEGILSDIVIEGLKNLDRDYLIARLPKVNFLFNENKINEKLSLLEQNVLVEEIEAEVEPEGIGKNILVVRVKEKRPLTVALTLTDSYSQAVGNFGGNLKITHNNLLGFGDRLSVDRSQTEGLGKTGASYLFPFNGDRGQLEFAYTNAHSEVILEAIEDLGIEADSETFLLSISQALIYQPDEQFTLGLSFELIDSESFVLGDFSFSFTEGLPDGRINLSILRFSQEYLKKWNDALFSISSRFSVGLDIFDATKTDRGIDGIFTSWQGEIQYLKAIDNSIVLTTRLSVQFSTDKLLPVEQFVLGGSYSVLGYQRNLGVADNGIFGAFELQWKIADGSAGTLRLIPFFHIGGIWNNQRETSAADFLTSVGWGLSYNLDSAIEARVNFGVPLIIPDELENSGITDNLSFLLLFYPLEFF